jgi:glycopeptide antibiotics resistance protein
MKRKKLFKIPNYSDFQNNWILCLVSILVILIATIYPFKFVLPEDFSLQYIAYRFHNHSTLQDKVENILLFMPLGFFGCGLLQKIKINFLAEIFTVVFGSAGLSAIVELLQVFLPSRTPTPDDIIHNTIGGFAGWLFFNWLISKKFAHRLAYLTDIKKNQLWNRIPVFFLGYIFLTFLIITFWENTTNLKNWNPNYPLLIGNELTENRAWQGYISEVVIVDKAIDSSEINQALTNKNYFHTRKDSLLAYYQLEGQSNYKDRTGSMPKLVWSNQPSHFQEGRGALVNSNNWLRTATPVYQLNKRISKTSEFTVSTIVATTDIAQTGPARIISISHDNLRRNFTLGQEGTNLNIRVRTPATGTNGSDIQMNIPNIFTDTKPHHIILTYSRANLQVYVDNFQNYYSLNLLQLMPIQHKLFYYVLTFIPLGMYLTLLSLLVKKKQIIHQCLIVFGIFLPSLILEASLMSKSGKTISWKNILIGILFTAGTVIILRIRAAALLKKVSTKLVQSYPTY